MSYARENFLDGFPNPQTGLIIVDLVSLTDSRRKPILFDSSRATIERSGLANAVIRL